MTFFPPIGDYLGWTNNPFTTFALVDYAGVAERDLKLANPKLRKSLGTNVIGVVRERERPDGTALVTVFTWTTNALGFAQPSDEVSDNYPDLGNVTTIFGKKAVEVADGAKPALGPVKLHVSFVIQYPGADLPDLVGINNNICNFVPYAISFESLTYGTRSDGTKAVMRVNQEASLDELACAQEPEPPTSAVFTKEIIEIIDLKK